MRRAGSEDSDGGVAAPEGIDGRDGGRTTADLARRAIAELGSRGASLALAESCTGGLLAAALTAVPGSSERFWGCAVVYRREAKARLLGLSEEVLDRHGTVSAPTTAALAGAVRRLSGATHGLAVTGWAGPEGGTPADPVGTAYVAVESPGGTEVRRLALAGGRQEIRGLAVEAALRLLLETLASGEGGGAATTSGTEARR